MTEVPVNKSQTGPGSASHLTAAEEKSLHPRTWKFESGPTRKSLPELADAKLCLNHAKSPLRKLTKW